MKTSDAIRIAISSNLIMFVLITLLKDITDYEWWLYVILFALFAMLTLLYVILVSYINVGDELGEKQAETKVEEV